MMLLNPDLDGPGAAAYSPSGADDGANNNPMVLVTRSTHRYPPVLQGTAGVTGDWSGYIDDKNTLMPPDPSAGGQPGAAGKLGYSNGLNTSRLFRQRFTGRTLVVPNMGAHPDVGPVGFSTRSTRLKNGLDALGTDYTPTAAQVADSFMRHGGF